MLLGGRLKTVLTGGRRRRPQVYLHIGAMKTGTTYLQQVMSLNKENLLAAGYLFPGDRWAEQSRAARDVLSSSSSRDPATRAQIDGHWRRLVDQMLAHDGRASIFSMEFLSFANAEKAARVVSSFPGADVHVILTVRDAAGVIPAQWQTSCRNGGTVPWPRFVSGVRQSLEPGRGQRSRAARMFQRTQGVERMLRVWEPLVGRGRLHVVTVPPRGSDPLLLWERFARVVGVDPAVCVVTPESSNPSLGHASTELVRRVNLEVGDLPRRDYEVVVRGSLRSILGARSHVEPPVTLDRRGRKLAARWNKRVRAAIKDSGAQVVGDLTDLPVRRPPASTPASVGQPTPEDILAAAATAKEGLLELESELWARLDGRGSPTPGEFESIPHTGPGQSPEQVAVQEVAALVRRCVRLLPREGVVSRGA